MQLKIGDKVRLASGGQLMTIKSIGGSDDVLCQWFWAGEVKEAVFAAASLRKEM